MPGRPKRRARAALKAAQADAAKLSRAPAPSAADVAPTREARVSYLVRVFAEGRWRFEASHHELAVIWSVAPATIRDYAAEASRVFKRDPELVEAARAALAGTFQRLAKKAEGRGELRTAIAATELLGRYLGVEPSSRTEITGKDGGPLEVVASAAEARRVMKDLFREVTPPNAGDDEQLDDVDGPGGIENSGGAPPRAP